MQRNNGGRDSGSLLVIISQMIGLSIAVMMVSYFVADRVFSRLDVVHKPTPVAVASTPVTTQAPAPDDTPTIELPGEADMSNPHSPLTTQRYRVDSVPFLLISGGTVGTRRSPLRMGVEDFVQKCGARAGLNGTFFANASLRGTDNLLIGPSICGNESKMTFSPFDKRKELVGRPLVLMSPDRTRIVPYDCTTLDSEDQLRGEMPDLTDAFLGGVWLVHHGVPVTAQDISKFNLKGAQDPRRRAFFALAQDGRPCLGATTYVATSSQLAKAIADSGLREAVLLDSGFSTSLVKDGKVLVTGHTAPGIPSRPVPHAIVLFDSNPSNTDTSNQPQSSASAGGTTPGLV